MAWLELIIWVPTPLAMALAPEPARCRWRTLALCVCNAMEGLHGAAYGAGWLDPQCLLIRGYLRSWAMPAGLSMLRASIIQVCNAD